MALKKIISFLSVAAILLIHLTGESGCANIVPPEGGPRDSLPPVLRSVTPKDSTLRFSGNKISFSFDEYIELDNPQQNLIVSPLPANSPTVNRKLTALTVKLRDTLEPNTTYTLNFGKTITDLNEKNVLKDFSYVFSTGTYIDSLRLNGKVILAENGETDSTLTVLLHRSDDDSILIRKKPRYVARTDARGNFSFVNLPPGTFYIYALQDQGGGYLYLNKQQLFAFADSAVVVPGDKPVTLYAYALPEKAKTTTTAATRNAKDKRLKFTTSLSDTKQDLLGKFDFLFETPVKNFDSSKVHFVTDTTFVPVAGAYSWKTDSTRKKITLDYAWKENTLYHLILEKDFATDTLGFQLLKSDTITFNSKSRDEYGKLRLRFRNLDLSQNPVLFFVQNGQVVQSFPLAAASFSQALFPPGEYNLRILNDRNKNGVWDPGEFFGKHLQPEIVKPIERKVIIKAGLDNDFEIDVTALPAPVKPPAQTPGRTPAGPTQAAPKGLNKPLNNRVQQ